MIKPRVVGRLIRDAWLVAGIAVLMFAGLELLSAATLKAQKTLQRSHPGPHSAKVVRKAASDSYAGQAWVREYLREKKQSYEVDWKSYVYWRRKPYNGQYINVNSDGVRYVPGRTPPANAVRIFAFGGSTMWGTGARDAYTIPAQLQDKLADTGMAAEVINWGETGYVSTQEVITLIGRLQRGDIPDLVIFYDGVNDTYSAYQQLSPGLPQNEANRALEFNIARSRGLLGLLLRNLAQHSTTIRLIQSLGREGRVTAAFTQLSAAEKESLSRGVRDIYAGNIEVVQALAARFHFEYLFYLQPSVLQKNTLTAFETSRRDMQLRKTPNVDTFYAQTYAAIRTADFAQKPSSHFRDLSQIFSGTPAPLFIDWCHLSERGNGIIAGHMAQDVARLLATPLAHTSATP